MGLVATSIYCFRNIGKANHGESERGFAASAQGLNSLSQTASSIANKVERLDSMANIGKNVGEKATKIAGLASKVTNPLLVGAAGVRVLKDEDKKSALTEEALAMGGMFASERMYKIVRNTIKDGKGDVLVANGCKVFEKIPVIKNIDALMSNLDVATIKKSGIGDTLRKLGEKISKLSSGKQKAVYVAAELGLVATSIVSYSLAKKIGKKITGRDQNKAQDNTQQEHKPFASLTVK